MESAHKVWPGCALQHGDLVPIVIEGRIKEKGLPGRPQAAMLDRVKDNSSYVVVKRHA